MAKPKCFNFIVSRRADVLNVGSFYFKRRGKEMNDRAKFLETNEEQKERIQNIRNIFSSVYDEIELNCKASRETSLALTKLEEAQSWAIKGITREV